MPNQNKIRLAWFSAISESIPLKSSLLLSRISKLKNLEEFEITLFVADSDWKELSSLKSASSLSENSSALRWSGFKVKHYLSAFLQDQESKFDFALHSIENHSRSAFCQHTVKTWPGLVLLLDGTLGKLKAVDFYYPGKENTEDNATPPIMDLSNQQLSDIKSRGWSMEIFDYFLNQNSSEFFSKRKCAVFDKETSRSFSQATCLDDASVNEQPFRLEFPLTLTPEINRKRRKLDLRKSLKIDSNSRLIGVVEENSLWADQDEILDTYRHFIVESKASESKAGLVWIFRDAGNRDIQIKNLESSYAKKGLDPNLLYTCSFDSQEYLQELIGGVDILLGTGMQRFSGAPVSYLIATEHLIPIISSKMSQFLDSPNIEYITAGNSFSKEAGLALLNLNTNTSLQQEIGSNTEKYLTQVTQGNMLVENLKYILKSVITEEALESRRQELSKAKEALFSNIFQNNFSKAVDFRTSPLSSLEQSLNSEGN